MKLAVFAAMIAAFVIGFLFYRSHQRDIRAKAELERSRFWKDAAFLETLDRSGKLGRKGIAVVAPASGLSDENARVARAIAEDMGIRLPERTMQYGVIPYNATGDETRLELLRQALNAPDIEVIWPVRGGYGSSRLLSSLADMPEPETRKIFIGYSDMTFLHLFLRKWNWRTVHGAMFWEVSGAGRLGREENFRQLASLLSGAEKEIRYTGLRPVNDAAKNADAPIEGAICGGNLTCLAAAAGTPWSLKGEGLILFLEDVKEQGYKIDRMLTQLIDAGTFEGARAVLLGAFTRGDEHTDYALERFAQGMDIPVFRTDQFGHGEKNYPLVFNSPAVIEKGRGEDGFHELRMDATLLP